MLPKHPKSPKSLSLPQSPLPYPGGLPAALCGVPVVLVLLLELGRCKWVIGAEPLPGETTEEYNARQARLREEARERMRAKFGIQGPRWLHMASIKRLI